jgi:CRP-like cAMP-binding protein
MRTILSFCQGLPLTSFAPGEVLLAEGGKSGILYILLTGDVEIVKGGFQVSTVTEPGAIFGEISVLLDVPHTATVKALTPCQAYMVENASAFLQSHIDIAYQLARLLAQRLSGITTYLADLKRQFADHEDHLGMVDEVLETLTHQQDEGFTPGSERYPDRTI